jgi:hypothetical protein
VWQTIEPGDRLNRLETTFRPIDVLLGGSLSEYVRLARAERLLPPEGQGRAWQVARRSTIFLAESVPGSDGRVAVDDPRVDPATLTWLADQLGKSNWREGYARIIARFGHAAHRTGWRSGSALGAIERGDADASLRVVAFPGTGEADTSGFTSVVWDEGAAICREARQPRIARAFLRFLAERLGTEPGIEGEVINPDVSDLLADLLGATLVDAQDELKAAWTALDREGVKAPASALSWMSEPPPWPPASVEKLQRRGGDNALRMIDDLAAQLAPDSELRFALVQSWLRPRRLIDDSLLAELAKTSAGRLVQEPRFRAWLRAEWAAWARQRYRRVARLAALAIVPPGDATSPSTQ